ncbi:MAG: LysR family transcriptional regulator [Rhodobacteraceae bacterium]|nr:LysR family transcriptional regulator [Paracoccaceae bacterium]
MPRNLDLTALRSFVTVAETGGVTKAAAQLNLTQSAVSMQLKRLEEALGQPLLARDGRGVRITPHGEQLLGYGRRILALNDEVWARMSDHKYEGEVIFGVPADIVYPHIPSVLRLFAQAYPRVKVQLISSNTERLKKMLVAGEADLILTTEFGMDEGGFALQAAPLIWVGAPGGNAWQNRPLRLAFNKECVFRKAALAALSTADMGWEMAVESDSFRTIEASVSADLAIHAELTGATSQHMEIISHNGALPELPMFNINLYLASGVQRDLAECLAGYVRGAYGVNVAQAAE